MSQYEYLYDKIGLRTSVVNQGTAFTNAAHNAWGYNDRGELTSSYRYLGTDVNSTTGQVFQQTRTYTYDPIGNRDWSSEGTAPATEYSDNNLNQHTATADPNETFDYDEDGNMVEDGAFEYGAEGSGFHFQHFCVDGGAME